MNKVAVIGLLAAIGAAVAASPILAQPAAPPPGATPQQAPRPVAYPARPVDPAAVERGKALYENNACAFCHGRDIRGGDGGPSLQRSTIVLNDDHGELIGEVLKTGRPGTTMPAFAFSPQEVTDIADYLHSFRVTNGGGVARKVETIVVGDAAAGRAYFAQTCASCHSITGDLAGFAAKFADPKDMQQRWIAPQMRQPLVAKATLANGTVVTGRPTKIDEFSITLAAADGAETSYPLTGSGAKVEMNNPLAPHTGLLRRYTDKNIHDVTAYLVSLK